MTKIAKLASAAMTNNVAKQVEKQIAKLPSNRVLWVSAGAMAAALVLKLYKRDRLALFIAQSAAPVLFAEIYNKIVKGDSPDTNDRNTDAADLGLGHA